MSVRAPVGPINFSTMKICIGRGLAAIRATDKIDREFLFYTLLHKQDEIHGSEGAVFASINKGQIEAINVALPSLQEQRRIVNIIDEAFAGLEAMRANAEKNLQNARQLFDRCLNVALNGRGDGWIRCRIGDQITLQRGFDITKGQQKPGEVPVVSSGGVKSYHNVAMVRGPGVVIGRKGTLGKTYFVDDDFWPHDTTLWVKDFRGNDPLYVYYFFSDLRVTHLDSGAANPALNRNLIHPLESQWPSVALQKSIVAALSDIRAEVERLETIYRRKLAAIDELKQSLLQKAFSGQLTSSETLAA